MTIKALDHYSTLADAASVPGLFELLREARAALGPEFYDLAGRIDDALPDHHECRPLLGSAPLIEAVVERDLVWENYGSGWGWFKADLTIKDRRP